MAGAPLPDDEDQRLASLLELEILGTGRTADFDIFPGLASQLFEAPMAAISFVDKDRQWFKASVGLDVDETPRDVSFCAHAIMDPDGVLCVPDATKDPRFADNPLVTGSLGLRFYAGAPIMGPNGHAMGTLCVLDRQPREVSPAVLEQLRQLATGVGVAIRLHASVQQLRKLSVTDALTGLVNRAGFNHRLSTLLQTGSGRAGRSRRGSVSGPRWLQKHQRRVRPRGRGPGVAGGGGPAARRHPRRRYRGAVWRRRILRLGHRFPGRGRAASPGAAQSMTALPKRSCWIRSKSICGHRSASPSAKAARRIRKASSNGRTRRFMTRSGQAAGRRVLPNRCTRRRICARPP